MLSLKNGPLWQVKKTLRQVFYFNKIESSFKALAEFSQGLEFFHPEFQDENLRYLALGYLVV